MVAPRTHGTVDIDGLAVFYEVEGDGETIVLLHGGLAAIPPGQHSFRGCRRTATWWRLSARHRGIPLTGLAR